MKEKKGIVPIYMWLPLTLTVTCNMIAYFGTRIFTSHWYHHDLTNRFEEQIPLMPWTITIYLGCYIFWVVNYVLGSRQDKDIAFRFVSADFLAKIVCMIVFLVFPTTNTRPIIEGGTFWSDMMLLLYSADAADNLLPSIHCLTSWFGYIAVRGNPKIPKWYKVFSILFALAVCVSTLTTKQHVIIDAIVGVALAECSYWFVVKSRFVSGYKKCMMRVNNKLFRRSYNCE